MKRWLSGRIQRACGNLFGVLILLCSPIPLVMAAQEIAGDATALRPNSCLQFAEFSQEKHLKGLPKPLTTRGKVVVDCNRGTVWNTDWPIQESIVYQANGKQWMINAEGEQKEIKNAAQKRVGNLIARIVRGDESFIDKHFKRESQDQTLRLLPVQKRLKKYIESIDIQQSPAGMKVQVKRVDGQDMLLEISGMRSLTEMDAAICRTLMQSPIGCDLLFATQER